MGSKEKGGGDAGGWGVGRASGHGRDMCQVQRLETSRCVEHVQVFQHCWLEDKGRGGPRGCRIRQWDPGAPGVLCECLGHGEPMNGQHLMGVPSL